jgi:hypothetical protein
MFIPDPDFFIPDPGSNNYKKRREKKISCPTFFVAINFTICFFEQVLKRFESVDIEFKYFKIQKFFTKLTELNRLDPRSGKSSWIRIHNTG